MVTLVGPVHGLPWSHEERNKVSWKSICELRISSSANSGEMCKALDECTAFSPPSHGHAPLPVG